jgi:hypothetical protein
MPVSYKNIIITPNIGQNADPTIAFQGANANVNTIISMYVYPDSNGALSFEGSAGQLFSITNDLAGSIFSVSDVSGLPLIEVNVTSQQITFGQYYGNVSIGRSSSSNSAYKLDYNGSANISGTILDSKGDVRDLPLNNRTASYVLTLSDAGKVVATNSNITVPNAVFTGGQAVTIHNNSSANIVISNAGSVTMQFAGFSNTMNRTLQQRGLATVLCIAANNFVISGAGLV